MVMLTSERTRGRFEESHQNNPGLPATAVTPTVTRVMTLPLPPNVQPCRFLLFPSLVPRLFTRILTLLCLICGWQLSAADPAPGAAGASFPAPVYEIRTWISNRGTSMEARFVSIAEGSVTLQRKDGSRLSAPLATLSENDQQYARKLGARSEPITLIFPWFRPIHSQNFLRKDDVKYSVKGRKEGKTEMKTATTEEVAAQRDRWLNTLKDVEIVPFNEVLVALRARDPRWLKILDGKMPPSYLEEACVLAVVTRQQPPLVEMRNELHAKLGYNASEDFRRLETLPIEEAAALADLIHKTATRRNTGR